MRIEESIHCGQVIAEWREADAIYSKSFYAPGAALTCHAHRSPHLAILLEGAYFERVHDEPFLRLPGDQVFYAEDLPHENWFGRLPSTCLNVQVPRHQDSPKKALNPLLEAVLKEADEPGAKSLSTIAKRLGYHPVYLARLARKTLGISIGERIREARIRRAAEQLMLTDRHLGDIAIEEGFYDQSHLANQLRRTSGFTPLELRHLAQI